MPSHGRYGSTSDIRWVVPPDSPEEEGEWYRRCPDCQAADRQCWWPLSLDYWWPRSMQRCRACNEVRKRQQERHRARGRRGAYDDHYRLTHRDQINARRRARRRELNERSETPRATAEDQAA